MADVTKIREEIEALDAEMRSSLYTDDGEIRDDVTPEVRADVDAKLKIRNDKLDTLKTHEAILAAAAVPERVVPPAPAGPEVMRRVEPFDGTDVRALSPGQARDRALAALDSRDITLHLDSRQKEHLERLFRTRSRSTDGAALARRLLLTETEHYRTAFMKVTCQTQAILTPEEARALQAFDEFRAMNIGTDSAGGFGVPVIIDPTIVLTGQGSPNYFFELARVEVITNDEWKGVSSAGVTWSFDAEAAAVSDDSPTLAQPNVPTHKAQGFIPYSIEVGMDYPGFANEMSTLLAEGYSELIVEKLTTGSGTNQPTGIVTALDANTNVEVTPTTDGAFGAVDLYKVWDALPIKYRMRDSTAWMTSTDVQNEVRNFGTTLGSNFTVDLTDEAVPRLFGRRYYLNDFMADFTGTTGAANLLIVGDWSNFLIAQRAGMSVELVPHLFDVTDNRPTGQRGWFAWARIGSDSINDLGLRLLQNA
jgi:HK97 family phage major capsid protein